jgi:glycosyltransferase involved in cell wall biosynthesis
MSSIRFIDSISDGFVSEVLLHVPPDDVLLRSVPRRELWSVMVSSLAGHCLARWDEPFGLVAAEASAAGTPVIAAARGALPEVVADGVTGFVVGDVSEATDAALRVGDLSRTDCRSHAERHLCLDRTIDAHEELYAAIAGTKVSR